MDVIHATAGLTVERFLAWEDQQEGKHEFDGTAIRPMTGGSRNHQRLVFNLVLLLNQALDAERFEAVHEFRVRIGNAVRYPDVCVAAGPIPGRTRTLTDALYVFEVLSDDSTDAIDCTVKRAEYGRLPVLCGYGLLDQTSRRVSMFRRAAVAGPLELAATVTDGALALPELGTELPLAALYAGVRLTD